jgi:hypothetical protein
VFNTPYVKGNGYGSFFVVALKFLKSTHIIKLLFFLGTTTTTSDNHVTPSTYWINPIVNNLLISCLTIVA